MLLRIRRLRCNKKVMLVLAVILWVAFMHWMLIDDDLENISCYDEDGGELPWLSKSFSPLTNSIYFHETSCSGGLDARQACSVEAAARAHPLWQIYVFFMSPVSTVKYLHRRTLEAISKFDNVNLFRIDLFEYSHGTPLEPLALSGALKRSRWRISHISDFLRYLTLYKYGGVYLDLDTIIVKSLDPLSMNFAARENDFSIAAGALAFFVDDVGRTVAEAVVKDLAENWRGDKWDNNGPGVIRRVLQRLCNTNVFTEMSAKTCQGFEVYGPELFYPVHYKKYHEYLKPQRKNYTNAYAHHIWNQFTKYFDVPKDSLYADIARKYCPNVFSACEGRL